MKELERGSSYDHSDSERKDDPFASTILGCGLDDKSFDFLFSCVQKLRHKISLFICDVD
jgi:hypothetical protein